MPAGLEELAEGAHEDEPAGNHERVSEPVGGGHALRGGGGDIGGAGDEGVWIKVVRVRVGRGRDEIGGGAGAGADCGGAHTETVLDEGDAEAGFRAVLCGVGGMQQVGEQEADELEGGADHAVPDEGEEAADGQPVNVDVVG